jgi:radical SAM protein with 4Fe4S-binding SPASM domain
MGCNMRCKHCGSSCKNKLADELTTIEALSLCESIAECGVQYITLTGGEPTTRTDWPLIASKLNSYKIQVNMVSNGWLIDETIALKAKEVGIYNFAISLDGLKDTHDYIRREGSFDHVMSAIDSLKKCGMIVSVITTINKINIVELEKLKKILINKKVDAWQLQYAMPMGEFHQRRAEMMIDPDQIDTILEFAYKSRNQILIFLGDCLGYYTIKEREIKKNMFEYGHVWAGCPAGKYALGILHNGDVVGCVGIRDKSFIEGNIRNKCLKEIWEEQFDRFRNLSQKQLEGICQDCKYGFVCLGGCSNARVTLHGDLCAENEYCAYANKIKADQKNFMKFDIKGKKKILESYMSMERYDEIVIIIEKQLNNNEKDIEILNLLHYAYFKLRRYDKSLSVCKNVLELSRDDEYANYGLIMNLICLNRIEEAENKMSENFLSTEHKEEVMHYLSERKKTE